MPTKIVVKSHGSIKIEGDVEVFDMEGNKFDLAGRTVISLCRCGHSKNKPFCDSTHRETGFQSEIKAFSLPPPKPKI